MAQLQGVVKNSDIAGVIENLKESLKGLAQQRIGKTGSLANALEKEMQILAAIIAILEMLQSLGQDANLKEIYDSVENNKKLEIPRNGQKYEEEHPYAIPTVPKKK